MIRKSLLLISIFSLLYGLIFLLAPNFFAEITAAEKTNIAWLRNIGASISGVLFVGLLLVYKSPRKIYDLFGESIAVPVVKSVSLRLLEGLF